jgi:hypothetical protein
MQNRKYGTDFQKDSIEHRKLHKPMVYYIMSELTRVVLHNGDFITGSYFLKRSMQWTLTIAISGN